MDSPVNLELKICPEEDHNSNFGPLSPDSEDFIDRYDEIIQGLDSKSEALGDQTSLTSFPSPDPLSPVDNDEDDFENFSTETPSAESIPSPFGTKDPMALTNHPARGHAAPFTGPFVSVVLSKLENMLGNSLHVNLLLIGIITQLASYPQPLLRSFLLNTNIVFQPSIRSLYQVLASVKNKIEEFASSEKDFADLLVQGQQYLLSRVDMSDARPELLTKDRVRESSVPGIGQKRSGTVQLPLASRSGRALPGVSPQLKNGILAAVLFPEFLKELAALAQEHSILCCKILSSFEESHC